MTLTGLFLQSSDLLPEALNISFKLIPAIMVVGMLTLFLAIGYVFKVADTEGMWVAGRSIGNIENGMAIGANWMSAASYLGLAGLVALAGFYGLAFIIGWTTGYFVLLIFLAAQMRRFGKYTAPDFVGDRFNSDTARAIGALTTILIGFVYSVGQARGMGLVGLYVFGTDYVTMVIVMMAITVGYLTISGMMGATKNMAVQYVILIVAFLTAVYVVGFTGGYSTVLPQIEYGRLIGELSAEFSEPFAGAGFYLWIATAFSLIFGTCGLPHVLVRFYTVENEKTARQSTVWGLFFILLLYWSAPALAAFGVDLYDASQYGPTFAANGGMSGGEGDLIVVLAAQLSNLPTWFVGLVAAGGIAAAIATTAGLFITASSAVSHDIYTNIVNPDATQRQQVLVGRATIIALGIIVTITAFDPPALVGELVALAFSLAAIVLFPMFFLGLWWENTNRQGALAGMTVGLTLWVAAVVNDLIFHFSDAFAEVVPAIGAALVGTPLVFIVTIAVSMATAEPPEQIKKMVRQCHSPEPMGQQQSAEDVVSTDGGQTPADD
ncbi:cation acetate symporter (plasmid) [Haloferax mediterranei ATCC 33500]|uniref:Cation acetate symporter n=1 Tax=Haloferax mediterranei (strain ATCC 33500 / DSM 1411 / JCM 8866 / NBRC 14739 / NCIMB 2177 / R-4) TaxID=523841 RepID=I3R9Q7_HALMT|nr:VC_2705 family sodium/solute symporter [Haloferax mediterranei]AFK20967.1 sodium/solute symporter [Haloferax mediterranei ATCC 33500]AHZ24169.1 sodium:proton symporter [Haloferax mediterranei ATCC 33500]EMA05246.1 sodium/solute symporter [Haloferax mediterranei ATCC 33500]MDX5989950.1 VC_2705 family sodium/solute symporter [Haloferax mediterranei ATCC 33500]QCQ77138.1 cation acetate symporter [Haloferax mediterranei ATCC 33500]